MIPFMITGSFVIERSHATSDQVRTGSMSDAKYSASADSPSWSGMSWSSGAVRFIAFRPGGSLKELRTSRSRRPSRGPDAPNERGRDRTILVHVKLEPDRSTGSCNDALDGCRRERGQDVNAAGGTGRACHSQLSFRMRHALECQRRDQYRSAESVTEHAHRRVAAICPAQYVVMEREALERGTILTHGDLVVCASVIVVEHRQRQDFTRLCFVLREVQECHSPPRPRWCSSGVGYDRSAAKDLTGPVQA